jgi:hypothetical protein
MATRLTPLREKKTKLEREELITLIENFCSAPILIDFLKKCLPGELGYFRKRVLRPLEPTAKVLRPKQMPPEMTLELCFYKYKTKLVKNFDKISHLLQENIFNEVKNLFIFVILLKKI